MCPTFHPTRRNTQSVLAKKYLHTIEIIDTQCGLGHESCLCFSLSVLTRSATNPKTSSHGRVGRAETLFEIRHFVETKNFARKDRSQCLLFLWCVLPRCSVWSNSFRYHQGRLCTKKQFPTLFSAEEVYSASQVVLLKVFNFCLTFR